MNNTDFAFRLKPDDLLSDFTSSGWVKVGAAALSNFYVDTVTNPSPEPKKTGEDIPGTSGTLDLTEEPGRVFYKNKTVVVTLSGKVTDDRMLQVRTLLSEYHGRAVCFYFGNPTADAGSIARYFHVGRMEIDYDMQLHTITFTIDAEPYRYTMGLYSRGLRTLPNYERDVNPDAWQETEVYGIIHIEDGTVDNFVYCVNEQFPDTTFVRIKNVEDSSGYFALGIKSIVGGDICFEWQEDGETIQSRTMAKIVPLASPDGSGNRGRIRMRVTLDGSYYEWKTVAGQREYLPTIRCEYVLTQLPLNDYGELLGAVSHRFNENTQIRPKISVQSAFSCLICDGVAVDVNRLMGYDYKYYPRIVFPGTRYDGYDSRIGDGRSVYAAVPLNSGDSPSVMMIWRDAEVW